MHLIDNDDKTSITFYDKKMYERGYLLHLMGIVSSNCSNFGNIENICLFRYKELLVGKSLFLQLKPFKALYCIHRNGFGLKS